VIYLRHLAEVAPVVAGLVRAGDLVITIGGGGDAPMIGEEVMELLREREEAAREAVG
jgi:hypothetical protein